MALTHLKKRMARFPLFSFGPRSRVSIPIDPYQIVIHIFPSTDSVVNHWTVLRQTKRRARSRSNSSRNRSKVFRRRQCVMHGVQPLILEADQRAQPTRYRQSALRPKYYLYCPMTGRHSLAQRHQIALPLDSDRWRPMRSKRTHFRSFKT